MTDARLGVDAELVLERDGRTYRVWSEPGRLVVEAPSLAALRALDDLRSALPLGPSADRALARAGLTVHLQVRRAPVARVGAGVPGDALGRWLTGTNAAVDPVGVATAALRALG